MNLAPLHYLVVNQHQQKLINEYAESLQTKILDVVGQAIAELGLCDISWGNGHKTFAVNRRENKPDSKVAQRRTAGMLKGPVDHDVPVMVIKDKTSDVKAVVFGYACHSTTLQLYQWSGGYAGYAQIELEKLHPGCVAMF